MDYNNEFIEIITEHDESHICKELLEFCPFISLMVDKEGTIKGFKILTGESTKNGYSKKKFDDDLPEDNT